MKPDVLIVEDERLVREGLLAWLDDEDVKATGVGSAEDAIALVAGGRRFTVCIMDIRLPNMDGQQAIGELHRLQPDLKFIVHTGSVDYSPPPTSTSVGQAVIGVLFKPVQDLSLVVDLITKASGEAG